MTDEPAVPAVPAVPPVAPPVDGPDVWTPVSPRLVWVDFWNNLIFFGLMIGGATFVWLVWSWWTSWYAVAALGLWFLLTLILTPRRIRAIGYRLRDDDLVYRKGVLVKKQIAVPYGRMQLIDITRGPIVRAYGLSQLVFHTASTSANISVEGLEEQVAEQLRDRLVALAESRRAGL